MTLIIPEATPVLGNTKVSAFLTCADMTAPKVATEITAASSVDLSFFIRDFTMEINANTGTAPTRIGTKRTLPQLGQTTLGAPEIHYVYKPQDAPTTNNNKAKNLLVQGTTVYVAVRKGLDAETVAWAAGQRTEVWKMICGPQNTVKSGDDEFAEFEISQILVPSSYSYQLDAVTAA